MGLSAGSRLGPYEITGTLGAGGMGEVYRATDTNLKRAVAIKVLPESVATDKDRLARFQREAEVLASLNHPNIAAIHGLERSGGITALVMELVEGPTLAQRIAQGPIPLEEALPIARQITEALEAAHEQGIIHRDLKPANIKVRSDGTVKVLDFGLAKAMEPASGASVNATASPTITSPAMMTGVGMLLGTAAYMSPEQARGKTVDKRSDIWAFGCVLFEVLTGKRPFDGENVADTLAAVVRAEPAWEALPNELSPSVRLFLRRCVEKNPKQRLHDIADMRLVLEGAFETAGAHAGQSTAVGQPFGRRVLPAVAGLIIGALSVGVIGWNLWPPPVAPTIGRFDYELPAGLFLFGLGRTAVAVSPDGGQFAFTTSAGLYVRTLGELEARAIAGAERSQSSPFFSPDGQSVGFFEGGQLRRISVNGGAATAICAATDPLGASWGPDNFIFFGQPEGIMRVSADGGMPAVVIKARTGEVLEGPQLLPDGDWLLFSVATNTGPTQWDQAQVVVESLRTGERKVIWRGGSGARYVSTGHLVYVSGNTLHAAAFDTDTLEIRGRPMSVIEGVMRPAGLAAAGLDSSAAQYAISETGTLVYGERTGSLRFGRPVWVGRDGLGNEITTMPVSEYAILRLSPDHQSMLTLIKGDLWIYDIATGRSTRLTQHGQATGPMAWHPSGEWVAYTSAEGGNASEHVWMIASDGRKGTARQLTKLTGSVDVDSWSPDGRVLGVHHHKPDGGMNILMVRTDTENAQPETFVENELGSEGVTFSPDGRHVAYMARDTGQGEIYIRSYPNAGGRRTVSVGGGREPVWGRSGELFYRNLRGDRMMVVGVTTEPFIKIGKPQELFARQYGFNPLGSPRPLYDVTHDGQRLLMLATAGQIQEQSGNRFIIVENWTEELKRLVPVN